MFKHKQQGWRRGLMSEREGEGRGLSERRRFMVVQAGRRVRRVLTRKREREVWMAQRVMGVLRQAAQQAAVGRRRRERRTAGERRMRRLWFPCRE